MVLSRRVTSAAAFIDFERRLTGKEDFRLLDGNQRSPSAREDAEGQSRRMRRHTLQPTITTMRLETMVYQAVRYAEPKGFQPTAAERKRWLDLEHGWGHSRPIQPAQRLCGRMWSSITEGEKDAVKVQKAAAAFPNGDGKLSYAASTNIGGAGKWQDEYSPYLAGKRVFVFADNDAAGRKHAQQVCASASKHAQAVHLVELPGLARARRRVRLS